jgi:hypothetical protein
MSLSLVIAAATKIGLSPEARADWCYTDQTMRQVTTDCPRTQDYTVRQGGPRKPTAQRPGGAPTHNGLRERLIREMREDAARNAAQSEQAKKIATRITGAKDRAEDALRRGNEATDTASRAKAQRDYAKATRDLSKAYRDAEAVVPAEKRAEWQQMQQQSLADFQDQAGRAFAAPAVPAASSPPRSASYLPKSDKDTFAICDKPDQYRIQTCYTAPRRGYSCTKMLFKDGDHMWTDKQPICETNEVLEKRNDYFANLRSPPPQFGDGDRKRAEAVAALSPKCLRQLNALLENVDRDERSQANAAYIALRAECEAAMRKLAHEADARLPERRLSDRSRRALDLAMSRDPNKLAEAAGDRRYEAPYNVDEIITLGLQLTDLLSGMAGIYASRNVRNIPTATAKPPANSYTQRAPAQPYKAPAARSSTITSRDWGDLPSTK